MLTTKFTIWTIKIAVLWETQMSFVTSPDSIFTLIEQGQIPAIPLWVDYLFLFYLVFLIGLTGMIFNYKNYLVTMFCIELMYLGITICFVIVSISTADPKGQIYAILLLVLAAAESAIGLGILIVLYRFGGSINFQNYQQLRT
jgi:NADH:ubiquinone oxidoreductase subunit K